MLMVFPADAGVILFRFVREKEEESIPRGCGGDPEFTALQEALAQYSPRMRG